MNALSTSSPPAGRLAKTINPWWFVVTGFLTFLFGTSTVNVLFNVLGKSVTTELGWDRQILSNGLSLVTIVTGASILVLGFLIDRFGPKRPAVPMAMMFGIGLMLLSVVPDNGVVFYLICVLIGAGAGAVNPVAHSTVITAWFSQRRGLALGILMTGLGACGVMMPYLGVAFLEWFGWRGAFLGIGLLCTLIPTSVYLFVTRMPPEHEQERLDARSKGASAGAGIWAIAKSSRQFWFLSGAIFLISSATFGMLSQVVPITTDKGIATAVAVTVLSVFSLSSVATRFLVGYLLDRVYAPLIAGVIFTLCGVGVFLMIQSASVPLIFLGAGLMGLGLGAEGDIAAYMTGRYFPKHSYGRVLGFIYFLYAQGGAFGIFVLGASYAGTGTYESATWLIIGMVVAAIAAVSFMGPYKYSVTQARLSDRSQDGVE
jgi:MFS family permease